MKKRIKVLINRLVQNITKPEMLILPGQLSFFFLLTLIPLLALFISIFSKINLSSSFINELIVSNIPDALIGIVDTLSKNTSANTNAIIFFISAIVLASNGTHSMIIASNKMYNIKDRSYIARKGKSVIMMFVLVILLLFMFLIPVFGDMIMELITALFHSKELNAFIIFTYNLLKFPLSFLLVFLAIKLLYIMAPDMRIKKSEVNYGAAFTSISWVLVTQLYSLYVENFSNYSNLYGSISNLLVLMWWIYLLAYIFVLGIGLNVTKYQLTSEK